jgi:hypothetical protein
VLMARLKLTSYNNKIVTTIRLFEYTNNHLLFRKLFDLKFGLNSYLKFVVKQVINFHSKLLYTSMKGYNINR